MTQDTDKDLIEDVALLLRKLRKCETPGFPCGFCSWTDDANEEMGCIFMAKQVLDACKPIITKSANEKLLGDMRSWAHQQENSLWGLAWSGISRYAATHNLTIKEKTDGN